MTLTTATKESLYTREMLDIGLKRLPNNAKVSADYELGPQFSAQKAKDNQVETYWTSGTPTATGNFKIIFENDPQQISLLRLKTGSFFTTEAVFNVTGYRKLGDPQSIDAGSTSIRINSTVTTRPQTVDIYIKSDKYEVLEIQCIGVPTINDIEFF
ncbi:hypothetical protein [Paenibacillus xylanexedens]|uniref:Uncharacterized protein n=1 Tax=Paenibacillus xylanexedens TaxID=528191 RepID=A0ABS4S2E9_PAEXY|nr:hypothetical protein [Paenibacillus xylanexedens]MBP2249312.1 hypothetical protein [Paenibacillus xylanexedens]